MQVGAHVWNGDKCGVVVANDESGVTVAYFASVETLTSDSENPSPLSSSPTAEDQTESVDSPATLAVVEEAADAGVSSEGIPGQPTDEPPAPADKPAEVPATEPDPLAALSEDERATYTRLQAKLNTSAGV